MPGSQPRNGGSRMQEALIFLVFTRSSIMDPTGNTILITGGGSGIGRGLAETFHAAGNQVLIAGLRRQALDAVTAANPGMRSLTLDVEDPVDIQSFAARIMGDFPKLNVLINNAGIMRREDLAQQKINSPDTEAIIATNLLGPIRMTAALLPLLRQQQRPAIINVSSGLAFVPLAFTPTYCATKAAIHSFTVSLRYQLKETGVEVIELIPPYVGTELMEGGSSNPRAMPLDKFIQETMEILKIRPTPSEICVKNVEVLRYAAENGNFDDVFRGMNDAFSTRN